MMRKLKWDKNPKNFISNELANSVTLALQKKYQAFLNKEFFFVEIGLSMFGVQVRITLKNADNTFVYPVEAIACFDENSSENSGSNIGNSGFEKSFMHEGDAGKEFLESLAMGAIDFLDSYWNEFLTQGRDTFIPLDWTESEFEGTKIFVRGFSRNVYLENMAEELFRKHGTGEYDIKPIGSDEIETMD